MAWLMIPFMILMFFLVLFVVLLPFVVATFIYDQRQISKRNEQAIKKDWERLMVRLDDKQQIS
ncbi:MULTISPECIES: hypothetical protein [unclassified Moraxella]|uniref:hypothetical protein n=1 Tax=unclassified Moraxella TaxID=2685852 RepID=UPI00359DDAE7